jgi:hypothetical protein
MMNAVSKEIRISEELAAKCETPDQAKRFDATIKEVAGYSAETR